MTNKLFVAGISDSINDAKLEELFSQAGKVLSAKVIIDRMSNRSRGYGFVEMENEEAAQKAINELNGKEVDDGKTLVVKEARPREDRNDRSFGNNRNNNRGDRQKRW